jgi:hypothetical protein
MDRQSYSGALRTPDHNVPSVLRIEAEISRRLKIGCGQEQ